MSNSQLQVDVMSHWLLRRPLPYGDIQPSYAGKPWPYDKVFADPRLEANDVVYLAAAYDEIYGCCEHA